MDTQLSGQTARQLAFVDEFWFSPSGKGAGLGTVRAAGPSLSGLRVGGRKAPNRLVAALAAGLVVVLVAAFFVVRMSGGAEGQVFAYALAQGEKRTYDLSITINGVAAGVPDAPPIQGTVSATMGYEVVSKEADGSSVVEFTLQNLRSEPAAAFGPGAAGGSLRVTIAPDGSVTDVEGVGGVFGAAGSSLNSFSELPGSPSDTAGSQFMFPQYPGEKIAAGDSWDEESSFPLPFGDNTITVKSTGKHNGFEDDPKFGRVGKFHHSISAPMDMEFTMADLFSAMSEALEGQAGQVPPEASNAVMKITGDMSMDADSLVIPDTSELVRLDGTAKMSMRMVLEGLPQGAGGPPGDLAFDMTMKITMLRVDGGAPVADPAADAVGSAGDPAADAVPEVPVPGADPVPGSDPVPGADPVPGSDPIP
jgi:hypothetical protein